MNYITNSIVHDFQLIMRCVCVYFLFLVSTGISNIWNQPTKMCIILLLPLFLYIHVFEDSLEIYRNL